MLIPISLSLHYSVPERTHANIQRTTQLIDHRQTIISTIEKIAAKLRVQPTAHLQHRHRQYSTP